MQIDSFLVIYLIVARLIELVISKKNTRKLFEQGAIECYAFHYKFIVLFHVTFIIYFLIKSFFIYKININLLVVFFIIQIFRYKVLYDLGKYWTTRIIVLKNKPLINSGIYKYLKHPNYLIVFIEIFLICLIFFDYEALLYFSMVNLLLIFVRIYFEEKANKNRLKETVNYKSN